MSSKIDFLKILVLFLIIDILWLAVIASGFYQSELAKIFPGLPFKVKYLPAALAYFLMAIAFFVFTLPNLSNSGTFKEKLLKAVYYGGLLGLTLYGVFDFTNMAIFPDSLNTVGGWTWKFTLIDIAWGFTVYSLVALMMQYI
jgi:uncharacterized membrane protein